MTAPLLQVDDLGRRYPLPRPHPLAPRESVDALASVSFTLEAGRTLGVVGESGSGKSTLARLVMALEPPSAGTVLLDGRDLHALAAPALRQARRDFQMVFQDPYASLDPRRTVWRTVAEPLEALADVSRAEQRERAAAMLEAVGLNPAADGDKYPHEFSGGQRQRIAIARALILKPRLVVLDEPTSALDRSVQAAIVDILRDLQAAHALAYLFISHDLRVVRALADDVLVMKDGKIVEQGPAPRVFETPEAPYTKALMAAALAHDVVEHSGIRQ